MPKIEDCVIYLTQKSIADPIDGKTVSRFCLTEFTKDEIKISIPDKDL